jgi:hypothetical protein
VQQRHGHTRTETGVRAGDAGERTKNSKEAEAFRDYRGGSAEAHSMPPVPARQGCQLSPTSTCAQTTIGAEGGDAETACSRYLQKTQIADITAPPELPASDAMLLRLLEHWLKQVDAVVTTQNA